jgi:hypothetical protein
MPRLRSARSALFNLDKILRRPSTLRSSISCGHSASTRDNAARRLIGWAAGGRIALTLGRLDVSAYELGLLGLTPAGARGRWDGLI